MKRRKSALDALSYGQSQRGFVDYDYVEKLDEATREWLEKFTAEYYGGVFTEPTLHNQDQKREIWRIKKRRSKDMSSSRPGSIPDNIATQDVNTLDPELQAAYKELQEIVSKKRG